MSLGETAARSLGQRTEAMRAAMVVACAVLAGAAVSAAGPIAFVGLVAPHLARGLMGHRHALLLPASALIGALMVVAADLVARRAFAPVVLPVGLLTGLVGAPFFIWLFWGRRNG